MRPLLREPLVHFLVIGGLLFALFQWRGSGPASNRIVISRGQLESLVAGFTRTWQRPPSADELKGLIDDAVREELAAREAIAMGLDRDDTIVRRRLRQKLEFIADDSAQPAPATGELQAWLTSHQQDYHVDPQIAFQQVFVDATRRGPAAAAEAARLLAILEQAPPDVDLSRLGDPLMIPARIELTSQADVSRQFGDVFANRVASLEPGRWTGPVASGYGLHLVRVEQKIPGRVPPLDAVRPQVERDVNAARKRSQLDALYVKLLARYTVVIEPLPPTLRATGGPGNVAGGLQ